MQDESKTPPKPNKKNHVTGFWAAKRALQRFGENVIDRRTGAAKAMAELRAALVADLGGPDAISAQQSVIIGLAVRTRLLLESLDGFIFTMHSPVNKRSRQLYPCVRERQQLADSLARYMTQLGLEKRKPPEKNLTTYLAERSTVAVSSPSDETADVCKAEEEHEREEERQKE